MNQLVVSYLFFLTASLCLLATTLIETPNTHEQQTVAAADITALKTRTTLPADSP